MRRGTEACQPLLLPLSSFLLRYISFPGLEFLFSSFCVPFPWLVWKVFFFPAPFFVDKTMMLQELSLPSSSSSSITKPQNCMDDLVEAFGGGGGKKGRRGGWWRRNARVEGRERRVGAFAVIPGGRGREEEERECT